MVSLKQGKILEAQIKIYQSNKDRTTTMACIKSYPGVPHGGLPC